MDILSEILGQVELHGALYFNAEFTAPWGVTTPSGKDLAAVLAPGAPNLVMYHLILSGGAHVQLDGLPPVRLEPGDVVVIPHGDAHRITSDEGAACSTDTGAAIRQVMARDFRVLRAGGGGAATRVVCGFMVSDPDLGRPLLAGLPPVFRVNLREDASGRWLESAVLHLVREAGAPDPGGAAVLAKLSEALFIDTLRRYAARRPEHQTGWLAAAQDPVVGRCLGLLHGRVDHPWTLAALASAAGVSRSALAERFPRFLGEPPMKYLARWRLQRAARALAGTPKGIAEIAASAGYESEAAFHRAFRREFGVPPARYRRERREATAAGRTAA